MSVALTPSSRSRLVGFVLAGVLAFAGGCGYRLAQPSGLARLAGARAVTLGTIENRTAEVDAAVLVAGALRGGIAARAGGTASPPLELGAVVERVVFTPVGFGENARPTLWRVTVRLRLSLVDAGRPIAGASAEALVDVPAGADVESTEVARRIALQRAVEQVVEAGLDRLAP